MAGNRTSRVVMVGNLASPFQTPSRRAWWDRVKFDRPRARSQRPDVTATNEAEPRMIEIVRYKIRNDGSKCACSHELIEAQLSIIKQRHSAHSLVGIVLPHHALTGRRIVGLANPGQQKQADIVEGKCRQND